MTVARDAWPLLLVTLVAAWLAHALCGWACAGPLLAVALLIPYLYREPGCEVPPAPLAVVSPVYGRVLTASPSPDPYLGRAALKVVIRTPVLGPFVLRSPIEGRVVQQWYLPQGLMPVAAAPAQGGAAAPLPADPLGRYAVWIQTDEHDDVVLVLRGAFVTRRLSCSVGVGERVGQGQRCGLMQFSAAAELYLPANCKLQAARGDAVRAGSAIIATLVHKAPPPAAAPG